MTDLTFKDESLYGSVQWVAATFGRTTAWFRSKRAVLEGDGFPKPDPILGYWIKADVDAWVAARRRIADKAELRAKPDTPTTYEGYNENGL